MRLARADTADGVVSGTYTDGVLETEDEHYLVSEEASLLPPSDPTTVYCAGRNYQDYLKHKGNEKPEQPHFFLKPPTALCPTETQIPYPHFAEGVGYAGELAAIVDEKCKNVPETDVESIVRGYTILNDLDAIGEPGSAMKVFDGGAPVGPWIETDVTPDDLDLETTVGNDVRQTGNTSEMLFNPAEIISFLSERVTLYPGDVIAFGSPANPGDVEPGETVEIWYEGVGTLSNELGEP